MADSRDDSAPISATALYLFQLCILAAGFLVGVVAAYWLSHMDLSFSGQLVKARRMGIVSPSILRNHSETEDILRYLATLCLPIIGAVGAWFFWSGKRRPQLQALCSETSGLTETKSSGRWMCLFLVATLYLLFFFDISFIRTPNPGWQFLGEEGEILAWVQRLINGAVYGKDFSVIYGPMLIYPLALVMKLFNPSVLVERVYTLVLNLIALAIIVAILFTLIRSRIVFLISALVYLTAFPAIAYVSTNTTYLRVVLGLLPLYVGYLYLEKEKLSLVFVIGVIVGQCCLFSQESAICSAISLGVLFLMNQWARPDWLRLRREIGLIAAGFVVSVAPMLFYFFHKGALITFIISLYDYPRFFSLGFNSKPFISLHDFFDSPFGDRCYAPYWIIFVYVISGISLSIRLILSKPDKQLIIRAALLVFGIILYRSALGRFDRYHVFYVTPPALLLVFLMIDNAITSRPCFDSTLVKAWWWGSASLMAVSVALLFVYGHPAKGFHMLKNNLQSSISTRWKQQQKGVSIGSLERSAVSFEPKAADTINRIWMFLREHTRPNEYVYFFPSEAAYYFLFNRKNPTEFCVSYLAVTADQRRELIGDLEKNRPEYVVYSLDTWRMDDIPEQVQVPEVVDYLRRSYKPFKNLGNVMILERRI